MTNRRSFLGLLAATPFVAPVVAKEIAAPKYASGGFMHSVGYDPFGGQLSTQVEINQFRLFEEMYAPPEPNDVLRGLMRSLPWAAPNRLYGAYIKDDGDAA